MAYLEVCHEMKLIVDLINQGGLNDMRYSISNTAEYGDMTRGPRIIDDSVKDEMKRILKDIQSGDFAEEFLNEINGDRELFNGLKQDNQAHLMEKVGAEIRSAFSWNNDNKIRDRNKN